jgi:cellulose synthase/poly-beta-1,6-N-acetylglucosamine synthase-like glycosyltransferase
MRELQKGHFTISDSPAEPVSLETHFAAFKISSVIAWTLLSLYFPYEIFIAFKFGSLDGIWPLWTILFAESCLTFQELVLALNLILCLFTPGKKEPRRSYELRGQSAPSVDVLITCCGESLDIILDTVKAAAAQNYPSNCFRVFVLDDGHDNGLQQAIKELGSTQLDGRAKVHYLSRTLRPGAKSFFKAGNLQYGIDESCRLGSSEFIAGLDADMIPEAQWLRKMVPHLIMSDTNGIAVNPQVSSCFGHTSWAF